MIFGDFEAFFFAFYRHLIFVVVAFQLVTASFLFVMTLIRAINEA